MCVNYRYKIIDPKRILSLELTDLDLDSLACLFREGERQDGSHELLALIARLIVGTLCHTIT